MTEKKKAVKKKPTKLPAKKLPKKIPVKKPGFISRTPGEKDRDLTISLMAKKCECILIHLKRMEDSAAFNREYRHAENYEKLTALVTDVIRTPQGVD